MDPNETLKELRDHFTNDRVFIGEPVKELFEALDTWLSHGGFLPDDWRMSITTSLSKRLNTH